MFSRYKIQNTRYRDYLFRESLFRERLFEGTKTQDTIDVFFQQKRKTNKRYPAYKKKTEKGLETKKKKELISFCF